jgi:hypothetical protein
VVRVTQPEATVASLAGGDEAVAEAREAVRAHLGRHHAWSVTDAANIARFLVTVPVGAETVPILDLALRFNADARARDMPPVSYGAFVAALAQLALGTALVGLELATAGVRIASRPAPAAPRFARRHKMKVTPERLDALSKAEKPDPKDDLVLVMAFAGSMLRNTPEETVPARRAHEAYLVWATLMDLRPLSYSAFAAQMEVGALGIETVEVITVDGVATYKGISL